MDYNKLVELWNGFGDIAVDENGQIESDYHIWKKGEELYEIWHWFDEQFPQGLGKFLEGK